MVCLAWRKFCVLGGAQNAFIPKRIFFVHSQPIRVTVSRYMQHAHRRLFANFRCTLFITCLLYYFILFSHPQLFDVDYVLAKTSLHDNSKKEKDKDDEYAFMAMVDQCPHKKVR